MSDERKRPFLCGSQFLDWQNRNCCRCAKWDMEQVDKGRCAIDYALLEAYFDDGSVSDEIAKRMGTPDDGRVYNWDCPEREEPPPEEPAKPAAKDHPGQTYIGGIKP
jgi:hypothetical protein